MKDEVGFLPSDKHQRFLQIGAIILGVCVARYAQITQNIKFAVSLQCLNIEVSDEFYFLHADKHEHFLQIDTIIFNVDDQAFLKFLK